MNFFRKLFSKSKRDTGPEENSDQTNKMPQTPRFPVKDNIQSGTHITNMFQPDRFPVQLDDNFSTLKKNEQPKAVNNEQTVQDETAKPEEIKKIQPEDQSTLISKELYAKGFPFYKMRPIDRTPRVVYQEKFSPEESCSFKKYVILRKIEKNSWDSRINEICFGLLQEAHNFAKERNFTDPQCLAVLEIFFKMCQHFMTNPMLMQKEFLQYFRELLLCYAIQNPPDSLKLFSPMEIYSIAQKFVALFDRNFDLLKAIAFPNFSIVVNIEN